MGWSINPSDLASIDSNGKVTFLPHTEKNITYTVTYSDANFTCSKSCTVYKCVEPCTCANANLNVAVSSYGVNIPGSGYTTSKTIGTYNINTCLTGLTATSVDNWVTIVSVGSGNINARIQSNPSFTNSRSSAITVKGYDSEGNSCTDTFTISQLPPICNCDTANFNVSIAPDGTSIPASGYTSLITIGTYNSATCLTGVTATSSENWVTNISVSNGNVNAKVSENASLTNNRTSTITVKGIDGGGNECIGTFIVTQVMSASTCTCANENFQADATAEGSSIPAEGYSTSTAIGEYTYPTCLTGVTATSNVNWVTITNVSNGRVNATVQSNSSTENERIGTITVSGVDAYGTTCSDPFDVLQVPSAITCVCDSLTVSPIEECVLVSAGVYNIGTYSDGDCVTSIAAYNLPAWISNVSFSNGTISGTVTKNEGAIKRETTISVSGKAGNDTCIKSLYVCQEACTDVIYDYNIDNSYTTEDGCSTNSHIRVACSAYTCDGTYISGSAQKGVYFVDSNLNDYELPANETSAATCYTINIYGHMESTTTFRLYGVVDTTISNPGYTFLKSTEVCIPVCICGEVPGTDNYFVDDQHRHILTLQNDEGSTYSTGDTCICGWGGSCSQVSITSQGTWYEDSNENVITSAGTPGPFVTAVLNSGSMGYYAYTDNIADYDRLERLTITPKNNSCTFDPEGDAAGRCKCTGGRRKVLSSSWDVIIRQSPKYRCGCSAYLWTVAPGGTNDLPPEGGEILLGTVQITNFVCGDHDDIIVNLSSSIRNFVYFARTHIREAGYVDVYLSLTENTTGSPRSTSDGDIVITTDEGMCSSIGAPIIRQLG